jgi:hypothetical protein
MIFPDKSERGIVVFMLWKGLDYQKRLALAFGLIAVGLLLQAATWNVWIGLPLILFGNLLLVVRGYDNRVDYGKFDPGRKWTAVEVAKLQELLDLDNKIKQWDRSLLDITNPLGVFGLILVLLITVPALVAFPKPYNMLGADALVLFVPHWVTGIRSALRRPDLMIKVRTIKNILARTRDLLEPYDVQLMMEVSEGGAKIPSDVKIKIGKPNSSPDFLGLYGQVVLNNVQGTSHPYFYVVLVARNGYGLAKVEREFDPPRGFVSEFKTQKDVEVLVIRRKTTKNSGYKTNSAHAETILQSALRLM